MKMSKEGDFDDEAAIKQGRPVGYDSAGFVDSFKMGPDMRGGKIRIETNEPLDLAKAYACTRLTGDGETRIIYERKDGADEKLPQHLTFIIPHHLINIYGFSENGRGVIDLDLLYRQVEGRKEYYMLYKDRNNIAHEFNDVSSVE